MPEYIPRGILPDDCVSSTDDMTRAYLDCAEWVGIMPTDEDDATGESGIVALECSVRPTWSVESVRRAAEVCADFRERAGALLAGIDDAQAGRDLWLTRNGHGTGFWDRGLGEAGRLLTEIAHGYGEAHVDFDPESETLTLVE